MQLYSKVGPAWWAIAAAGLVCALIASSSPALRAQGKTAKDAVYSPAQAKRGEALYQEQCASCHSADLSGGGAPALAGGDFLASWDKTPLADVVTKITLTMPASAPGSINREQATDIATYVLQANKFPAGDADLASDEATLKAIAIVK